MRSRVTDPRSRAQVSRAGTGGGSRRVDRAMSRVMQRIRAASFVAAMLTTVLALTPQRAMTLESHRLRRTAWVRARRPVVWSSARGDVEVRFVGRRRLRLVVSSAGTRVEHAFERPLFGSGPAYAEYASWHPESLAVRVYETAPSLGWPRFTACVHVTARPTALRVDVAREDGTELGCE